LERQAKHEIVQFYFNDRFYYYMNSYLLDIQQITEDLGFFNETTGKVNQALQIAYDAQKAGPELEQIKLTPQNTTTPQVGKRLLTLDMRNFKIDQTSAHFQDAPAPSPEVPAANTTNSTPLLTQAELVQMYKSFINLTKELDPALNTSLEQLNKFSFLQQSFTDGIGNNFDFSDAIMDLRDELQEMIMNYLFENNYKDVYKVEEQHIWMLGWLLYSKDQFDSWSIRPKDMISSARALSSINKTDFVILNDYLEDLIKEVAQRAIFKDIDNSRFGFHILRGLRFNITAIENVTNCTNKELYCPCPEERDPMNHTYCDPLPKKKSSKSSGDKRILATVNLEDNVAQGPSNTAKDGEPAKSSGSGPGANPYKKNEDNSTSLFEEKEEEEPVQTPYTAITSLQSSLSGEKDITSFILAFRFIMRNYLYDELLHGYDKQHTPDSAS
jgi:hypothetical protein